MADPKRIHRRILEFALGLPEAYQDHPWEETVAKVNKKVFVFLGSNESPSWPSMTVKLGDSLEQALAVPGAEPAGYGLGRSGWVTIPFKDAVASSAPLRKLPCGPEGCRAARIW